MFSADEVNASLASHPWGWRESDQSDPETVTASCLTVCPVYPVQRSQSSIYAVVGKAVKYWKSGHVHTHRQTHTHE